MLRALITVTADTDIVGELATLREVARRQHLSESVIEDMVASVESSLSVLKDQAAQTALHGIGIAASQSLCQRGYTVTLKIAGKNKGNLSNSPFFRLFGK